MMSTPHQPASSDAAGASDQCLRQEIVERTIPDMDVFSESGSEEAFHKFVKSLKSVGRKKVQIQYKILERNPELTPKVNSKSKTIPAALADWDEQISVKQQEPKIIRKFSKDKSETSTGTRKGNPHTNPNQPKACHHHRQTSDLGGDIVKKPSTSPSPIEPQILPPLVETTISTPQFRTWSSTSCGTHSNSCEGTAKSSATTTAGSQRKPHPRALPRSVATQKPRLGFPESSAMKALRKKHKKEELRLKITQRLDLCKLLAMVLKEGEKKNEMRNREDNNNNIIIDCKTVMKMTIKEMKEEEEEEKEYLECSANLKIRREQFGDVRQKVIDEVVDYATTKKNEAEIGRKVDFLDRRMSPSDLMDLKRDDPEWFGNRLKGMYRDSKWRYIESIFEEGELEIAITKVKMDMDVILQPRHFKRVDPRSTEQSPDDRETINLKVADKSIKMTIPTEEDLKEIEESIKKMKNKPE